MKGWGTLRLYEEQQAQHFFPWSISNAETPGATCYSIGSLYAAISNNLHFFHVSLHVTPNTYRVIEYHYLGTMNNLGQFIEFLLTWCHTIYAHPCIRARWEQLG